MEVNGFGNLDDVVLHTPGQPGGIYAQVKWATEPAGDPVSEEYLFASKGNGRSILQKLHASWLTLKSVDTDPELRFITNRALAGTDPLLGKVEGETDRLVPFARLARPNSDAAKALQRWAVHTATSVGELLTMLDHLHFHVGRTKSAEIEHARDLMLAVGLDDTPDALRKGLAEVSDWIVNGIRTLSTDEVREAIDRLQLQRKSPSLILSVQAIDVDTYAHDADQTLNWVHMFDGDTPRARTVPRSLADWETMSDDIDRVAAEIESTGTRSIVVRGAMRQATLFRIGVALPQTRNFDLTYAQGNKVWTTSDSKRSVQISSRVISVGDGDDIAVAVAVSVDPSVEVLQFLTDNLRHTVSDLIVVTPNTGPDDQAVDTGGHAVALAEQIRNEVRAQIAMRRQTSRIHLFMAGPGGSALFLGHRWNRLRTTTVYEHKGIGLGYQTAFDVKQ